MPPGQAAKSMPPMAMAGGTSSSRASKNAIRGSRTSWPVRPMSAAFGNLTTRLKSAGVSDKPIPSISTNKMTGTNLVNTNSTLFNHFAPTIRRYNRITYS